MLNASFFILHRYNWTRCKSCSLLLDMEVNCHFHVKAQTFSNLFNRKNIFTLKTSYLSDAIWLIGKKMQKKNSPLKSLFFVPLITIFLNFFCIIIIYCLATDMKNHVTLTLTKITSTCTLILGDILLFFLKIVF